MSNLVLVLGAWMYAKLLQSHPTICDPMDCILSGSSVCGILQQEYWSGLISRGPSWLRDWTHVSYVSCIGKWVLYHQHPLGRSLGTEFLLDVAPWGSLLSVKCCWFSTWTRLSLIFISSVQSLSHTRLFATHGLRHASLPCLSPAPGACSNSCPSSQ